MDLFKYVNEKIDMRNDKLILVIPFGSKLYGTDTENSDLDIFGLYIPPKYDMLVSNYREKLKYTTSTNNTKNTKDDIDVTLWSVQYFFNKLYNGDITAYDILIKIYSDLSNDYHTEEIDLIRMNNIKIFLNKESLKKSLYAYVKKELSVFGFQGSYKFAINWAYDYFSNLESASLSKEIIKKFIDDYNNEISNSFLNDSEYKKMIVSYTQADTDFVDICGSFYPDYSKTFKVKKSLENKLKKMDSPKNITDNKKFSHAYRCAVILSNLVSNKHYTYPMSDEDREKIINIKKGNFDIKTEAENLNEMLKSVNEKLKNFESDFDKNNLNNLIFNMYFDKIIPYLI